MLGVFIKSGELRLRYLSPFAARYAGFPLHATDHDDPYAFRINLSEFGLESMRVVFGQDDEGVTTQVHLYLMP